MHSKFVKYVLFGLFISFTHPVEGARKTYVEFLIADPQTGGAQYRGFQVGVRSVADGKEEWYAKIRFSDKEDRVCSNKGIKSQISSKILMPLSSGIAMLASSYFQEKQDNSTLAMCALGGLATGWSLKWGISKSQELLRHWESKVEIRHNVNQKIDVPVGDAHLFIVRKEFDHEAFRKKKLRLFEWELPSELKFEELVEKINTLRLDPTREGSAFPSYTLCGMGFFRDAVNCVSFSLRVGEVLGLKFSKAAFSPYLSYKQSPYCGVLRRYYAKPESIAKAILMDVEWKEDSSFRVLDSLFWITSRLEGEEFFAKHPRRVP